jgi:hypothetical protein
VTFVGLLEVVGGVRGVSGWWWAAFVGSLTGGGLYGASSGFFC